MYNISRDLKEAQGNVKQTKGISYSGKCQSSQNHYQKNSMVCMPGLQGESHTIKKEHCCPSTIYKKYISINQEIIGRMFCVRTRPKTNILAWKKSITFGKRQTLNCYNSLFMSQYSTILVETGTLLVWEKPHYWNDDRSSHNTALFIQVTSRSWSVQN